MRTPSTPRGRAPRSRARAGRPCRRRPSRASRCTCRTRNPCRRRRRTRRRLDRGLGEREEVRPEPHAPVLAEHRAHHVQQRALQIGKRDVRGRRRAPRTGGRFGVVRRVDRVTPVDTAERDDIDRRLASSMSGSGRGGLRAQQRLVVQEERSRVRPARVSRWLKSSASKLYSTVSTSRLSTIS